MSLNLIKGGYGVVYNNYYCKVSSKSTSQSHSSLKAKFPWKTAHGDESLTRNLLQYISLNLTFLHEFSLTFWTTLHNTNIPIYPCRPLPWFQIQRVTEGQRVQLCSTEFNIMKMKLEALQTALILIPCHRHTESL